MPPLRIVFAGSPAAAVPSLRRLLDGPHEVVAVVTREDSPQGRKRVMTSTPVALEAEAAGVPVIRANRLAPVTEQLRALDPDLGVIVAYGGIIREPLLGAPRLGWINLHFSLLPRWRGAAPVQRAIMAGDVETGAAVFRLVPELDAGEVYATVRRPIGAHETAGHLLQSLAESGAQLLAGVVDDLAGGAAVATVQQGEVTLAPKLTQADGRIDWAASAVAVDARIRGTTPEPGAFTELGDERIKVLDALIAHDAPQLDPGRVELRAGRLLVGTASDPVQLVTVQPAGRRAMPAADWWRGRPAGAAVVAS
ncbi:methionyl-tRNA formyltransferase [Lysinimonas soli]|uniref:Methionyl-tRNA formyltransferase n=1 Tax=Lysinimonas soli TaxID=1074233 RepID=A0ABW0NNP6_9MICO